MQNNVFTLDKAQRRFYNGSGQAAGTFLSAAEPWREKKDMKKNDLRRALCAMCALVLLFSSVFPATASASQPEQEQSLSAADVQQMQQADAAVTALTESSDYIAMTNAQRQAAAVEQLEQLAQQGLVKRDSIYVDETGSMVSFAYTCGALGGILLEDPEEVSFGAQALQTEMAEALAQAQTEEENRKSGKTAAIYYAFDDTVDSTRYPHYVYMQAYWTAKGLDTNLITDVTVSSLRKMGNYDLCVLSAHGAYYTYQYGWLFKRTTTAPVILLTEKSDFWTDLRYGLDLLAHRIIKVNGMYAVTADFFRAAYRFGQLDGTIVISETCEFFGKKKHQDLSFAQALLDGGASTVVGYINNVYAMYSRNVLWAMTNLMINGCTVQEAMDTALELYGTDDLIWYHAQGGKRPHALASYPILCGQPDATLMEAVSAAEFAALEQAA